MTAALLERHSISILLTSLIERSFGAFPKQIATFTNKLFRSYSAKSSYILEPFRRPFESI